MSIKFLIVDEYLQEIRKCFGVILRKMVTIAKSSLCEERKNKENRRNLCGQSGNLKKVIAIQEKNGYNKLIHYPYHYGADAECIRF